MNSKVTSIFGIIGALGGVLKSFGLFPEVADLMIAIGMGGVGLAARDNWRSSESVGAKSTTP
jgi:hypothetical protein